MVTRKKKLLKQRKPCAILLERLRESKWPPNYYSWIFRNLPNISRLLKSYGLDTLPQNTGHKSPNFTPILFVNIFSACHGNQSSCSLECWRSSVIKRAMIRRMFIWGGGGGVKKGNRVVLECNYWLCILLSSPELFLPPTIKDCMIRSVSCINICFIGEGSCIWWKCSCA